MASLVTSFATCIVTTTTWCFCSACASLLGACCGNDKPSTVPPSITSGRKRSVGLLLLSIVIALAFQYGVAPALVDAPEAVGYVRDAWLDGCENLDNIDLQKSCSGNNGVYRSSFASSLFFCLAAIAVCLKPTANREAWPAKYILFLFLVVATVFIPNVPLFSKIFLNIARIGGIVFIFVQQLIVVDMSYNWNDEWVQKADTAEAEEPGSGKKWLAAILVSCAILFGIAIAGIILMFVFFTGCATNTAFISVTLILCIFITGAQLSGEEGSLLSSACVSAWAVFLLYSAVTKNPDGSCNPMLGQPDPLSIALGLIVTVISLGWTGWSYTAEDRMTLRSDSERQSPDSQPETNAEESGETKKVTGVVTGESYGGTDYHRDDGDGEGEDGNADDSENSPKHLSNSWRLNIILAAIACWAAMVLTRWGEIASDGSVANPSVGNVAMWMVIASQWIVLSLYLWTLIAPRLFPNRDFS